MSKRLLVVGGGGFIGSHLVEEALARGYETWVAVRSTTSRRYLTDERLHFIDLDYGNVTHLQRQLSALKERVGGWHYILYNLGITKSHDPSLFEQINFHYPRNLVLALLRLQMIPQRFLYLSSLGAWGEGDEENYTPISETDPPRPNTHYGRSKLQTEQFLAQHSELPYTILRPTGVYGARECDYLLMMKAIQRGIDFGAGYRPQQLTFIYVKDLVRVAFDAIIAPTTLHRAYFVSEGRSYTQQEFRALVAPLVGRRWVIPFTVPLWVLKMLCYAVGGVAAWRGEGATLNPDKYRIMKQRNWRCDISPLERDLHFSPRYSLQEGLAETIAWYKKEGWLR